MGLHVGVFGAVEPADALDGEVLDLVDDLAAAVVAGRGVTLGVFVGQNRTHGFHHLVAHEVLRGDQLDAVGLTAPLGGDQIENPGISFHVDVFWNVGFFQCVKIIKFDENRPAHNLKYFSYLCVAETK